MNYDIVLLIFKNKLETVLFPLVLNKDFLLTFKEHSEILNDLFSLSKLYIWKSMYANIRKSVNISRSAMRTFGGLFINDNKFIA